MTRPDLRERNQQIWEMSEQYMRKEIAYRLGLSESHVRTILCRLRKEHPILYVAKSSAKDLAKEKPKE